MPCPYRTAPFRVAVLAAAAGAGASTGAAAGEAAPMLDAIWRVEQFDFTYHSANVHHTCATLRRKIGRILKTVGAHKRVVIEIGCNVRDLVNYAYARITLAVPAEASPENVRAATTYDTHTVMIAKLKRVQLPTAGDLQRFPAVWRTISLANHRDLQLDSGDCDLLRDMRDQIFAKLAMEVQGPTCISGAVTRMRPKIEVSALIPVNAVNADQPPVAARRAST